MTKGLSTYWPSWLFCSLCCYCASSYISCLLQKCFYCSIWFYKYSKCTYCALLLLIFIEFCLGFGWDRVNFHKKLGEDTARTADPNWPNKWDIRYHMISCLVLKWGSWLGKGNHCSEAWWENCNLYHSLLYILFISITVVVLFCLCCSVKLSLSQSISFAFFLQFCFPPHQGEGVIERLHGWLLLAGAKPQLQTSFLPQYCFLTYYLSFLSLLTGKTQHRPAREVSCLCIWCNCSSLLLLWRLL